MNELDEHDRRVAFDKKYVLRSEYERDIDLARSNGRVEAATFCILVLPVIIICLFLLLRAIGLIQPGDFGIG